MLAGMLEKGTPLGAVEDRVVGDDNLLLAHGAGVRSAMDTQKTNSNVGDGPELQETSSHVVLLIKFLFFLL